MLKARNCKAFKLSTLPSHSIWAIWLTAMTLSTSASAIGIKLSGDLPRDLAIGFFDLTIVVSDLAAADKLQADDTNQINELAKKRIQIKVTGVQGGQPLRYDSNTRDDKLYLEPQTGTSETDANGNQKINFIIRVRELADKLSVTASAKELKIAAIFLNGESKEAANTGEQSVKVNNAAPNKAPDDFKILSSNKKLVAYWTVPSTIPYEGASDKAPPSQVRMFWIAKGTTPITLNAFTFNKDAVTDTATTCTYDPTVETGGECVVCNGTNVYLSDTQTDPAVRSETFAGTQGTTSADLDLAKKYAVFLSYTPFALKRTACIVEQPTVNYTLTEINGQGEAEHEDLRCFIATATYGSPLHAKLATFRWLRGRIIHSSWLGRQIVRAYYRLSPPAADFIARHERLKTLVRAVLDPLADGIEYARRSN